ncbi:MAG: YDG domain-containing protein [Alphaproteobacteria bacterium]|nr:YDG domain-containing protein [Alphaproteobacteria bacterium]
MIFTHAIPLRANPQGGVVNAGSATISSNGSTVHINQHTDRAVIDWRGFDIAPNERTEFQQPSSGSIALNRVNSGGASHIDGQLSANGNIVIVNQNGVVFGRGAQVDVNSLIATTSDIRNEQFMSGGKLVFDKPSSNPNAQIINEGRITAKDAGLVGLVAPRVENRGVIAARLGRVHLASGETATVDFYGDGLLEVAVSDKVTKQFVSNTGVINADGGLVAMTAAAGKNIIDSVISGKGTISAKTIPLQNNNGNSSGKILIAGNSLSDVIIDGLIEASGLATGQTGGAIHIIGNRIALMNNTRVDVSGNAGAGEILVGGDYHGGAYRGMLDKPATAVEWGNTPGGYSAINTSPTAAFFAAYYEGLSTNRNVPTASRVFIDKNVMMVASSDVGNAGRIITWSNNGTAYYGHADLSAKGIRGNGGFIEVSGKDWLGFNGTVNTHAANGANGMLLLDPADITISNAIDADITPSSPFDSTGAATSNLDVVTLQNALASGAVTITSAAGTGGTGNITFVDAVSWNSSNALTVTASNNIIVNNTITNSGSGSITLNANIAAAGSITIASDISTGGSITMLANRDITLNATRTLTTGATGAMNLQAANGVIGGTGNLTISGNLSVGSGGLTLVSGINGTRPNYTGNNTTLVQNAGTLGAVSITGFQDVSIARAITSNSTITINPQRDITLTSAGSLTSTGAGSLISILAQRDITLNASSAIVTSATGAISLQAANGSTAGTGNLTLNGNLSIGTGNLTLLSGINGTRPNLTLSATTFTQLGATVGTVSLSGFQDITLSTNLATSAALTIAATGATRDFFASGTSVITSTSGITINPGRDFITSGTASMTAGGSFSVLAQRDITIGAGTTVSSNAGSGLSLQAANNSVVGTGNLTITGNISVGTGSFTLVSGINGTRPSLTLNTTTLTPLGASIGAISITGLQDVTVARNITGSGNITISPQRDFIINAGAVITTGGTFTSLAQRDITINATGGITTGATGAISLQAANNVITGTGNLTINGNLSIGTGTLTLVSGINGTRPSLTLNSTTLTPLGATIGTISITGMQDVTVARNITGSGAITISPQQSFTLNNSATLTTTGTANITILALRDITVAAGATMSGGNTGSLILQAANNVVAGTGNLTLSGNVSMGTGVLTLSSGINGTRPSWTIDNTTYTQLTGSVGVVTINGFQDVTVSKNLTGTGNITINPQRDFILSAGNTITTGAAGVFTVLALRDITTAATSNITTGATGGVSLRAANAVIAGTGNLTLGGTINIGTGALTLLSGINGTRPSITLDSTKLTLVGATVGAISITGFQDVTLARNLPGSSTVTISPQRDFALNSGFTLSTNSASAITILALRDITTAATSVISAGTTGSITLQAANNVVAGTGNLTLNGNLAVGSGTLTLRSGINGTRPSWTMDNTTYTQNSGTVGVVTIDGFQDVTVSKAVTGSGNITINPQRDFILSASQTITVGGAGVFTVLALRDIITNASSNITTGATGGVSLRAANAVVTGTGNLTLGGKINIGTGALTLVSGINGTRPSWTMNSSSLALLGATVGTTSITGFQDVTVAMNLPGSGSITIATQRDLTLNTSQTITTGAAGGLTLTAANNTVAGTGNLTLSGNLSVGTGALTLLSGINGTRPSYTLSSTNFTQQGASLGALSISGFLDFTLNRSLTSSAAVAIISNRDLNINAGNTLTGGAASAYSLQAANGAAGGTGNLNILGNMSAGTGNFTLLSGNNGGRPALTLNSTNLAMAATVGNFNTQGFSTLTISRAINSTGTITNSNNTLTVLGANITSTGTQTYSNATAIAEAASVTLTTTNAAVSFSTTLNGTAGGTTENLSVVAGTGTMTFTGIVGGTTALGNLSVTADNLTISANVNGTGTLTLQPSTAARIIVLGGAQADNLTTNGFNLSTAEVNRLVNGWGSIVFGNTTSGALTNTISAWNDPVSFTSGNDFASSVALTSSDTIFIRAARDVLLTQTITTTNTSANAIVLVAGRNFINTAGANPLTTGAGGRWLVYSTNPTDTTGEETMSNAFNRYTCTYGGSCPTIPGTGNGLLYSYTPMLDVTIDPQTYNYGDAIIPPTGYTLQTSGYLNALDSSQGSVGGVGNFATSYVQGDNAGTSFTITNNGSTFTSNLGYGFNYISPTGLTVGQRAITVQVSDQTRVYGNAPLNTAYTLASGSFYSTDAATLNLTTDATLSSSGNYNYRATPWALSANGATFTSGLASNYNITYLAAPTGLTITQRPLTVSATGVNRVYDGLTGATVNLGDNRVSGDVLTASYTTATFLDKNVANGKTVNVSGINLTNIDADNYTFNTTTSTTANITPRALTISATGVDKVYNGNTTASVNFTDDRVAGDVFTTSYGSSTFGDKNVGTGKAISVTGINITTGDAGNYTFNTTASASADITQRALTITATGVDKVYNGLTAAAVSFGDDRVAGDIFTINYTGNFGDKNVGVGKAISVTGINLTGTDSGNYSYASTASTSADITQRSLTITATGVNKVYNGNTTASVNFTDDRVAGDVFTISYSSSAFGDKNVGAGKAISVTGINIATGDAGNYTYNTTASTSADITQRALTISATGVNKIYNGNTTASVNFTDDRVAGDVFTTSYGAANFANKNVGTAKSISVTGINISTGDAGNYTFNTTASASADITQRALIISATGVDKVYNGNTTAGVTFTDDRVAGDVFTTSYGAANFANKNVGTAKSISVTGINISTGDAGNYTFNTTASASADITQRALTISATGVNKVYNGNTTASVNFTDDRVAGDVFTTSYGAANFSNKNVGISKSISVTGINITTGDAANYTFNTTASTSADITQRALTISATGVDKVYNGNTTAGITFTDDRVAGDVFNTSYGAANFSNKNVGVGKSISVTGINITTGDAGNYTFNTTASASADITQRTLNINATGVNKVYDGSVNAGITLSDNRVAGDVFTTTYGSSTFADKNVGTTKAITVTGLNITGGDSGNYTFNTTDTAAANITKRTLLVTAVGASKIYDGLTATSVTLNDNRVAGDVFITSYGAANFVNKNVGVGKSISVTGINVSTGDAGNYNFNTTASASATITPRTLVASIVGHNKIYDGTTNAGIHITDNRIAGDVFGYNYNANFGNKNVGVGKTINVTGIGLVGVDSANYTSASTGAANADITPRALLISATGVNKIYDGNDNAIVTLNDNRVSGDILTYTYSGAHYSSSSIGSNKPVNVIGLTLTGADSSNYTYNSSAVTIADILATGAPVVVDVTPAPDRSLALQLPNTVKKSIQTLLSIPEFLIFDDEWQKRQRRLPTVGMLR